MPPLSSAPPTSLSPSTSSPVSPASISAINNSQQAMRSNVSQYNNAPASIPAQQLVVNSNSASISSQENGRIDLAKTPQSPPVVNRLDLRDNDADDTEVSIKLR